MTYLKQPWRWDQRKENRMLKRAKLCCEHNPSVMQKVFYPQCSCTIRYGPKIFAHFVSLFRLEMTRWSLHKLAQSLHQFQKSNLGLMGIVDLQFPLLRMDVEICVAQMKFQEDGPNLEGYSGSHHLAFYWTVGQPRENCFGYQICGLFLLLGLTEKGPPIMIFFRVFLNPKHEHCPHQQCW